MQPLATLQDVKSWLGSDAPTDNSTLTRLINQASQFIYSYIQRPDIFKKTYSDAVNGYGNQSILLRNWPVTSVTSVIAGGLTIPASPSPPNTQNGYILAPWDGYAPGQQQQLSLIGYSFANYPSGNRVTYVAGYWIENESHVVPGVNENYAVTLDQPAGSWARNEGVTLNGTALTRVDAAPDAGEYSVSEDGIYTFNSAQAGATVLISYSFIPDDLRQACIEITGERYRYSRRIGQQSNTTAGQLTVTYSLKDMQDYVKAILDRYKRVF